MKTKLGKLDVHVLGKQSNRELAKWWTQFNSWEWPDEMPRPEPNKWIKDGRRGQLMSWISDKITHKECLRYWNRKQYPGVEFDKWWETRPIK